MNRENKEIILQTQYIVNSSIIEKLGFTLEDIDELHKDDLLKLIKQSDIVSTIVIDDNYGNYNE